MKSPVFLVLPLFTVGLMVSGCSKEAADEAVDAGVAKVAESAAEVATEIKKSGIAGAEIPDYEATKISDHTWAIHGPTDRPNVENQGFMNNPVFTETSDSVVVIDPGSSLYSGRMVLRQIEKVTDKPVTVVFNSHIHGDHWLGNHAIADAYPDARFYAHPKMIEEAKAGEAEAWINMLETMTEGATKGTVALIPTEILENGKSYEVGGMTFKAHLTEHAHTKTDAMIEIVEDSVLVTGDNAFSKRMGRMDDGSFRGSIAALDLAIDLNVKHYVPGHGLTGGKEVPEIFRTFLQTIYSEAEKFAEEGLQDFEMKEKIHAQLETYHDWPGYEEDFGKHVSLAVLEVEQAAFE